MKKITILSLHLGYGGIEKAVSNLANSLTNEYEVEIISTYKLYDTIPFKLNDKVSVKFLITKYKPNREEWKDSIKKFKLLTFLKQTYIAFAVLFLRRRETINAIKKSDADIIISTRSLFNRWLGKYGRKDIKKVAWEHNHHHGNVKYAENLVESCRNIDYLVLVSDSLRSYYKKMMKERNYKCRCIYIPNSLDNIPNKVSKLDTHNLISVGRLSREKGFPDLIDVFELAYKKDNSLTLDIVGDGTQRNMVVDMIYQKKLNKAIKFHGYQDKEYIDNLMDNSSLYLMTSFTESFGIVLIEAMSHGLPCISFTSAEGANDLIKNNYNGYLINDRDKIKMSDKIIELVNNKEKLKELGINARNFSLNYDNNSVKKEWLNILKKR